ncbi:MAG: hypothetical protein LBV31_02925, partial [Prevotellaceae bacterium]|nr:hypothetical protein [Prevotellaceae bacterium]
MKKVLLPSFLLLLLTTNNAYSQNTETQTTQNGSQTRTETITQAGGVYTRTVTESNTQNTSIAFGVFANVNLSGFQLKNIANCEV